jgi:DNA-nicking Smr family endonuclease
MNFGDILEQWEGRVNGNGGKADASGALEKWLDKNGVYDKDADVGIDMENPQERRSRLLKQEPDAVLDLHFMTKDEAWNALERFFAESRERGCEKLLIIHGKGKHSGNGSALRGLVDDFLERCGFAGEKGISKNNQGGSGATWVMLKRPS